MALDIFHGPWQVGIFANALDADVHSHRFVQLMVSTEAMVITLDGEPVTSRAILVGVDVPHSVERATGKVFNWLLDPESAMGQAMQGHLAQRLWCDCEHELDTVTLFPRSLALFDAEDYCAFTRELADALLGKVAPLSPLDERITQVLRLLSQQRWPGIEALADAVALSPSRLSHLFADQMGVSIHSYLKYVRLKSALGLMHQGLSLTQVAQEAGFYDSAHLSRTFRQTFGVAPKSVRGQFRYVDLGFCRDAI